MKAKLEKALVRSILQSPFNFDWTLQGFGMLRMYLAPELRMHVWDSRFKNEGVSEMHTHPWNFHSYVVAGEIVNERWQEVKVGKPDNVQPERLFKRQTILCGEGGGLEGDPVDVVLRELPDEIIHEDEMYSQLAKEIHVSHPADGTVTIIEREFLDDTDHAYVYFQGEWVTAEPRKATSEEIYPITQLALEQWFNG